MGYSLTRSVSPRRAGPRDRHRRRRQGAGLAEQLRHVLHAPVWRRRRRPSNFAVGGLGSGVDAEADKRILNNAFDWAQLVDFVPDIKLALAERQRQRHVAARLTGAPKTPTARSCASPRSSHKDLTAKEKEKIEKFRKLLYTTHQVERRPSITDEVSEVTAGERAACSKASTTSRPRVRGRGAAVQHQAHRGAVRDRRRGQGRDRRLGGQRRALPAAGQERGRRVDERRVPQRGGRHQRVHRPGHTARHDAVEAAPGRALRRRSAQRPRAWPEVPLHDADPGRLRESGGWTRYTVSHSQSNSSTASSSTRGARRPASTTACSRSAPTPTARPRSSTPTASCRASSSRWSSAPS